MPCVPAAFLSIQFKLLALLKINPIEVWFFELGMGHAFELVPLD